MTSVHTTRVAFFASTAAIGGFLFGFDSAVVNGAVFGIQRSFGASSAGTGFAVASILLGCALGALVAGRAADRFGRKPVMVITAIVFAATALWSALSGSAVMFTIARFASGIAVGAASVVSPAYTAEISPPRIRGRLASLQQLGIVVGIFAALLSDHLLAKQAGGAMVPCGAASRRGAGCSSSRSSRRSYSASRRASSPSHRVISSPRISRRARSRCC